ncbi:hypothetical protein VTK73DRAFT_8664 [Phialemonium thermophilum]|uniref:BZIP domain-containing protein n=1 Tax=Phialemonium thermophilum TaxID=223376 RepID=A0ABR3XP38_9PEZI
MDSSHDHCSPPAESVRLPSAIGFEASEASPRSPLKPDPPKKRRLTAARKEQNRLAQRAYRQRQRELRRNASRGVSGGPTTLRRLEARPCSCQLHVVPSSARERVKNLDAATPEAAPSGVARRYTGLGPQLHPCGDQEELLQEAQLPFDSASPLMVPNMQREGTPKTVESRGIASTKSSHPHGTVQDKDAEAAVQVVAPWTLAGGAFQPQILQVAMPEIPQASEAEGTHVLDTITSHSALALLNSTGHGEAGSDDLHPPAGSTPPGSDLTARTTSQPSSLSPDPSSLDNHLSSSDPVGDVIRYLLGDPCANTLQPTEMTTLSAVLHNALCLGFDLSTLLNCAESCVSPFYRLATPGSDPRALLAEVTDPSTPAHLRPTLAQVLIPHHASLDLLPLPTLRERAIMLSAAMPQQFDLWELKLDVYVRGALVCWRGGRGGGTGGFQPWDMRSWEAAPWFLRKWRLVIDGEEGEFGRQSLWWRGIRSLRASRGGRMCDELLHDVDMRG